jgi:hypothetical protein
MSDTDRHSIATTISEQVVQAADIETLAPEEILEVVARTVVERYQNQQLNGFDLLFSNVEHHIIWNTPEDRQWLIVNFLEVLKNVSSWADVDYQVFEQWLGPESHVAWRWLEKRWQGNHSLADTLKYGPKKISNRE